ncbi:MAG: hypothetical protein HYZ74_01885, partial [Elusimicrobia bacterium]|nr:hypothetical protein [Elusimicrobiota bacterium]
MHVNLKPLSPHCAVMEADDPYKKYWWVILLGCAFTALWLLMPMLGEQAIGSTSVDAGKPKTDADVEQTLAAGDAGSGVDLSMDGTGKKKKADGMTGSMLYQVVPGDELNPEPAAAAGASASAGGSLANELAKVSRQSGGWGEKAQRGFNAPRLAGSSLSGMGAASGGRAGGISGSGAFGTRNAQVGFAATKSLSGGAGEDAPESKGLAALKTAADLSESAVANRSNDAATTSLNRA